MNTIGQNIAYFRKQKQLTQEELAEKMSVTAQAVSKWECDASYPDITVINSLAKVLGISVDSIFNGSKEFPEMKETTLEKLDRRILRVHVQANEDGNEDGDTTIITRFPVAAINKAMENGTLKKLVGEDAYGEVVSTLGMIDAGLTGPIVEVNHPGAHVTISVEDYEI
ncbi:MAG: helix-turn-helix transcriptional regulator [Clostridia bacterium]|nr:helix-turn-helix transcriptional regulator [Clostridia bacterium]